MHPKKSQVHRTVKCQSDKPETRCDYLSFQTWKIHECVSKWERQCIMLAEIKTEAARHCTVALFSESFAWNPLYLFSVFSSLCLSLSLSVCVSLLLSLSLPSFPLSSLSSLAHCSLSPPAFDAHTLSHSIDSLLFSVLTLKPSGAFARQRQPLLRVLVMCAAQSDRAFLFCLFTLTKD